MSNVEKSANSTVDVTKGQGHILISFYDSDTYGISYQIPRGMLDKVAEAILVMAKRVGVPLDYLLLLILKKMNVELPPKPYDTYTD